LKRGSLAAIEVVFLWILRQVELYIERPGQKLKAWQTVAEWDVGIRGKLVRNDLKAGILCQICEVDLKPEARVIKPGGSVEIEVPQMGAKGSRWVKFQVSFSEMDKGLEEVFEQFGTLCI
jgi:hypothetical protein